MKAFRFIRLIALFLLVVSFAFVVMKLTNTDKNATRSMCVDFLTI